MLIYVGSSGGPISVLTVGDDGVPRAAGDATAAPSPSWLGQHPRLPVLYAVHELAEGAVAAYLVEDGLRPLSTRWSGGAQPCHLTVTGDHLLTANYGSGTVGVLPVAPDGTLGEPTDVAHHRGGHAHQVLVDGAEVTAVDLGADRLFGYRLSPAGRLTPTWTAAARPGAGPRHLVAHPSGRRYVADELGATVSTYVPAEDGGLRRVATVPATSADVDSATAEIALAGDFLYVSNRGPDTISVFAAGRDRPSPVAEVPTGGVWPRHFTLVGPWLLVANERSDSVTVLRVDAASGIPAPTGASVEVPSPTCLLVWE